MMQYQYFFLFLMQTLFQAFTVNFQLVVSFMSLLKFNYCFFYLIKFVVQIINLFF